MQHELSKSILATNSLYFSNTARRFPKSDDVQLPYGSRYHSKCAFISLHHQYHHQFQDPLTPLEKVVSVVCVIERFKKTTGTDWLDCKRYFVIKNEINIYNTHYHWMQQQTWLKPRGTKILRKVFFWMSTLFGRPLAIVVLY